MSWKDDLNYGLAAFGVQIPDRLKVDEWSARLAGRPARNTLVTVAAGATLFYYFERDFNPKVNDMTDALLYCSTCLSVGYADVHPVTRAGKLLGTLLMTYGPALAAKTIDGPAGADGDVQADILATVHAILGRLGPPAAATAAQN